MNISSVVVRGGWRRGIADRVLIAILPVLFVSCRPGDVLSVPPPVGVTTSGDNDNTAGAESELAAAKAQAFNGLAGAGAVIQESGLLADEFRWSNFSNEAFQANVDARVTEGGNGFLEAGDVGVSDLAVARVGLIVAVADLQRHEPPSGRARIGEAFALLGYVELVIAEDYCAGMPLGQVQPGGGIQYGMPVSTDSLLAVAEAHFDSALAYGRSDTVVAPLASTGLARALLDRSRFSEAATAAMSVPTSFVYNTELQPTLASGAPYSVNLYAASFASNFGCPSFNVSDREGGDGLNFVTANDPRLTLDTAQGPTCDGGTWYYPTKFGEPTSTYVPLATGVEARLIEAEGALRGGLVGQWAADLNALRSSVSGMSSLPSDSTAGASADLQVDVMFRERAFWLFGTGTRLGDLRRLVRQYGRAPNNTFPSGTYANGQNPSLPIPLPVYGSDVSLTLPTAAGGALGVRTSNPNYKGCLNHDA